MASKSQRRQMRASKNAAKILRTKDPKNTAKFLLQMDNVAKATRNSERRRTLLEQRGNNGTTD